MISVVLAAGYATRLYPITENFPKPLLDVGGVSILDRLLSDVDSIPEITRHVVVSNQRFFAHFEKWKRGAALKKPVTLLNDGSTQNENRLGAVRDVHFAMESASLDDDLMVLAGDNLLDFSLRALSDFFGRVDGSAIMCYAEPDPAVLRRCGVAQLSERGRVISMQEKPAQPASHWAAPPFYIYKRRDLPLVGRAIDEGLNVDAPGSFISYLCAHAPVYALKMPGARYDVGDIASYNRVRAQYGQPPVG